MKALALILLNLTWIFSIYGVEVYGPETMVHYLEKDGSYMKVDSRTDKLEGKASRYGPGDNVIQPKMLLVYDYWEVTSLGDAKCIELAKKTINYINKYYSELNSNPKVEVVLSGIIMMKYREHYPRPTFFQVKEQDFLTSQLLTDKYAIDSLQNTADWRDFTIATRELQRMEKWLEDNKNQFENFNHDFFLYSFPWYMADDKTPDSNKHLILSLSNGKFCSRNPGVIVNNFIGYEDPAYPIEISYLLGISHPKDRADSHYFTSTVDFDDGMEREWRNLAIEKISGKSNAYYCIKDINASNNDL